MKFRSFKIVKICLMIKIKLEKENFGINILFCNHYFVDEIWPTVDEI
jgi:hypothetical protein